MTFNDQGKGENRNLSGNNLGLAHFAFVTNNLNALIKRLHNAGFEPDSINRAANYRRNVYYIDPDGFEVEFVEYLSDIPSERNEYTGINSDSIDKEPDELGSERNIK